MVLCLFFYIFLFTPVRVVENSHKKRDPHQKKKKGLVAEFSEATARK
nr:MAG TPA: hypothetical protein [Caudoviricetes sp.]